MSRLAVAMITVLALAGRARAGERVVVISDDRRLVGAVEAALASAGFAVVGVPGVPLPEADQAIDRAAELADRHAGSAVVWVGGADGSTTILVYDRGVHRVLIRALPIAPPFSAADAATAAQSARTMLRALRVTPDLDAAPPSLPVAAGIRARAALPATAPARPRGIAVESGAALAWSDAGLTTAVVAGAAWRWRLLSLALLVHASSGIDVDRAEFLGRLDDDSLTGELRVPLAVAPRWQVEPAAGASLHLSRLYGVLSDASVRVDRYDLGAQAGVTVIWQPARTFAVALSAAAELLLTRREYVVGMDEIAATPWARGSLGLSVRLGFE